MKRARTTLDRKRLRRRALWIGLAVLAVAVLGVALIMGKPNLEVEVASIQRGTYVRTVEEDGRTRVRDRYLISAALAGRLERPVLRVGDPVAEGQLIAVIHPTAPPLLDERSRAQLRERIGAAEGQLAAAKATEARVTAAYSQAEQDFERASRLLQAAAIPREVFERTESGLAMAASERNAAQHAVHAAEHDLEQARAALRSTSAKSDGRFEIRSPASGTILQVFHDSEGVVAPGAPIFELGDPHALEVVVDLLSTDAVRVQPWTRVEISGWGGSQTLHGIVRTVQPVATIRVSALGVEEERVDVIIDPVDQAKEWARIGHGYRVEVSIPLVRIDNALRVPTSALFRADGEWRAFVVDDGVARERKVAIDSYGPTESAAASGLQVGDLVVLQPPASLKGGTEVDIRQLVPLQPRSNTGPARRTDAPSRAP